MKIDEKVVYAHFNAPKMSLTKANASPAKRRLSVAGQVIKV